MAANKKKKPTENSTALASIDIDRKLKYTNIIVTAVVSLVDDVKTRIGG